MITMQQAISQVLAKLDARREPESEATDAEVIAQLERMAAMHGYRPAPAAIPAIRAYLSGHALLLSGDPGVGKTFLMRCLHGRLRTAAEIAGYGLAQLWMFYSWTDAYDIVIDDLGAEPMVSEYGAKEDVLKAVIAHREPLKFRTHITTNLTAEQIAKRYGDRTLSRLIGMCRAFKLTGPDMRGKAAL